MRTSAAAARRRDATRGRDTSSTLSSRRCAAPRRNWRLPATDRCGRPASPLAARSGSPRRSRSSGATNTSNERGCSPGCRESRGRARRRRRRWPAGRPVASRRGRPVRRAARAPRDDLEVAHRDAAGGEDEIGVGGARRARRGTRRVVDDRARESTERAARGARLEGDAVGVEDLPGRASVPGVDEFGACRDDGDAHAAAHVDAGRCRRRRERRGGAARADAARAAAASPAWTSLPRSRTNSPRRGRGAIGLSRPSTGGVLDRDDGVGPVGDGAPVMMRTAVPARAAAGAPARAAISPTTARRARRGRPRAPRIRPSANCGTAAGRRASATSRGGHAAERVGERDVLGRALRAPGEEVGDVLGVLLDARSSHIGRVISTSPCSGRFRAATRRCRPRGGAP